MQSTVAGHGQAVEPWLSPHNLNWEAVRGAMEDVACTLPEGGRQRGYLQVKVDSN